MDTAAPADRTPEPPAAEPAREPRAASRRPRDMALSLIVLLIPVFLIVVAYRVLQGGDQPVAVDPAPAIAEARAAGLVVAEPTGLRSGWQPASAQLTRDQGGAVLRIGYRTPSGTGAQLVESSGPAEQLLPAELTSRARPAGTEEIGGRTWQRYAARPGERAFVLLEPARTVIVLGSATDPELRELVVSLR
ncbi:MAG TPA: DUF4245 domain-containing protein [Micromonosporaceae bacterium]